jgi:hypothetical protein
MVPDAFDQNGINLPLLIKNALPLAAVVDRSPLADEGPGLFRPRSAGCASLPRHEGVRDWPFEGHSRSTAVGQRGEKACMAPGEGPQQGLRPEEAPRDLIFGTSRHLGGGKILQAALVIPTAVATDCTLAPSISGTQPSLS